MPSKPKTLLDYATHIYMPSLMTVKEYDALTQAFESYYQKHPEERNKIYYDPTGGTVQDTPDSNSDNR